jgi:hypothetical protein
MVEAHFTCVVTVCADDGTKDVNEVLEVSPDTRAFLMTDEKLLRLRTQQTEAEDLVSQMAKLSVHCQDRSDLDLRPLTKALLKPFVAIADYLRVHGSPEAKEAAQKAANELNEYS